MRRRNRVRRSGMVKYVRVSLHDRKQISAILRSAERFLDRVVLLKQAGAVRTNRQIIWPSLGDAVTASEMHKHARLVLMPLERLGSESGASGCHVVIGRFERIGKNDNTLSRSHPLVIKFPRTKERRKGNQSLAREKRQKEEVQDLIDELGSNTEHIAAPLWLDTTGAYHVLWSVLEAAEKDDRDADALRIYDLRHALSGHPPPETWDGRLNFHEAFRSVFELLRYFHAPAHGARKSKSVLKEYRTGEEVDYLRRFNKKKEWGKALRTAWPSATVRVAGKTWPNPIHVLSRLGRVKVSAFCRAVHGDLHPRNIVFAADAQPRIIDFGWVRTSRHVVKDFALLECNLRFQILPPHIPVEDMLHMARWIHSTKPPSFRDPRVRERAKLIEELREIVRARMALWDVKTQRDFDREYVIPLFLVAFGLLKHLHQAQNQTAALLTVLSLAKYIDTEVLPRLGRHPVPARKPA